MKQWKITIEYFPGSVMDRDRWYWQMAEYGEFMKDGHSPDAEQACEDIAWTLTGREG